MPPSVSVVMPVWNGEEYLAQAVASILNQTFSDLELIVVDDGSTDRTPEILKSFTDSRLRAHRLEHGGIVTALNYGVAQAQAEWIARQDADDISLENRLQVQWGAIQSTPGAVLCFSDVHIIGAGAANIRFARLPRTRAFTALRLCYQCPMVHSTVLFRKDSFLASGGYRPEERHAEDFAAWGRLLEEGPFVCVSEPLLNFRVHPQSVSKQNLEVQIALTARIATRHCETFMRLSPEDARRAFGVLYPPLAERRWSSWIWLVTKCVPRLRWQSIEIWAWLFVQTLRLMGRSIAG